MKICPKCGTSHNKNGKFCGRSCANSRIKTDEIRAKVSATLRAKKNLLARNVEHLALLKKGNAKYWLDIKSGKRVHRAGELAFKKALKNFTEGRVWRRNLLYRILIHLHGNKCSLCPVAGFWENKLLRLIVDHIDGNASNNLPNNLRLVCPNCNSQLPTFAARNMGRGRQSRGLKY